MTKRDKYLKLALYNTNNNNNANIKEVLAVKRFLTTGTRHILYYIDYSNNIKRSEFYTSDFFENYELYFIFKEDYKKIDIIYNNFEYQTIYFNINKNTTDKQTLILYFQSDVDNIICQGFIIEHIILSHTRNNLNLIDEL